MACKTFVIPENGTNRGKENDYPNIGGFKITRQRAIVAGAALAGASLLVR